MTARRVADEDANARKQLCSIVLFAFAMEFSLTDSTFSITPISWHTCTYLLLYAVNNHTKSVPLKNCIMMVTNGDHFRQR